MLATPAPSLAESRDNAAFDALLWTLSRPGLPRDLPEPGEQSIVPALLDRECLVYAADPLLMPEIMRTGAELADIDKADHVFLGAMATSEPLADIAIGSDYYPDEGATVIVRASLGAGSGVRLTGPGVDGAVTLQLGGLPNGFWKARAARLRYPMGFDLFFVDGARVVGVPRSTTVEEL
ncbi:phosphonate C-P lyase system protein PhnH [Thiosulfatihalobacter marinus]|uniref:phosphonate C-P lyase system protein PhnH n=1 Tax=Thiosulfatihalobacter marinus TaxID=2792481 RepID=UPI0018D6363E|nr:phosphonate C-P lyase system protein PhnH [Thiosulfatihalobacter marinus]